MTTASASPGDSRDALEGLLRDLVDDAPDGIEVFAIADRDGIRDFRRVYLNHAAAGRLGVDRDELIGSTVREHAAGPLGRDLHEFLEGVVTGAMPGARILSAGEGSDASVYRIRGERIGDFLVVRASDVTERVVAERLAVRREGILRAVATAGDRLLAGSWRDVLDEVLRLLGRATDVSRVYVFRARRGEEGGWLLDQVSEWAASGIAPQLDNPELQGLDLADLGLGSWLDRLAGGEAIRLRVRDGPPAARKHLESQGIRSLLVLPIPVRGGWWGMMGLDDCERERHWSEGEVEVLRSAAALLGSAVDRELRAEEIEEKDARLAASVTAARDAFLLTTRAGELLEWNPAAVALFGDDDGRPPSPALGLPGLFSWIELEGVPEERWVEWGGVRADGGAFPAEVSIAALEMGRRELFALSVRDLTHQKELEDRLWQAQKLDTVGRLAAGVAHDFNNLLTVVGANSDLAIAALAAGDDPTEELEEVARAAARGSRLTQQLLAFSRRQVLRPVPLDLNAVVRELAGLFRPLIGEQVLVELDLAAGLPRVEADSAQMEQVIMNLILNARDALTGGGHILVRTAVSPIDARPVDPRIDLVPGPYVVLTVSDDGEGMAPGVRDRIFEPFFTTKGIGGGTGLGLATVYGIVKQSRGEVTVYSEPGRGTTFRVYLPALVEPSEAPEAREAAVPADGARVLILDDDMALRQVAARVLDRLGYRTTQSGSLEEALVALARDPPELLVADFFLPGTDPGMLRERMREANAGLPILWTSGHPRDSTMVGDVLGPEDRFLEKPFTVAGLDAAVREALAARGEA